MDAAICQQTASLSLSNAISFFDPSLAYEVIATGLSSPRHLVVDPSNNLLVVDRGRGILALNRAASDCAGWTQQLIINDTTLNTGIALAQGDPDSSTGMTLYASSEDQLFAYDYDPATMSATAPTLRVQGMGGSSHNTRTIVLQPGSAPSWVVMGRGSDGNLDETAEANNRAQIRRFPLTRNGTVSQWTDGELIASGVRNAVGMTMSPGDPNTLHLVENSADNLAIPSGQVVANSNPGEKLQIVNLEDAGRFYGYPTCFTVFDGGPFPNDPATGSQFSINGSTSDDACRDQVTPPRLLMPAHYAPLDLEFMAVTNTSFDSSWIGSAFVTSHGSWDATPPVGYALLRIPYDTSSWQPIAPLSSQDGFQTLLAPPDLTACPNNCFRPAGVAVDTAAGGSLFVTGDSTGEIIRIFARDNTESEPERSSGISLSRRNILLLVGLSAQLLLSLL